MTNKYDRESILDAIRDAWNLMPDLPFCLVVNYIIEGEDLRDVGDTEMLTYANDFILNNT
jgi:hypothetical protein